MNLPQLSPASALEPPFVANVKAFMAAGGAPIAPPPSRRAAPGLTALATQLHNAPGVGPNVPPAGGAGITPVSSGMVKTNQGLLPADMLFHGDALASPYLRPGTDALASPYLPDP
jgi:hypothetical protein